MDENGRDYDQQTFQTALAKLIRDPRAHDVDIARALAVELCVKVAPENDAEFAAARAHVLRTIQGLLISIEPVWRQTDAVDAVMTKIDAAIWPAYQS